MCCMPGHGGCQKGVWSRIKVSLGVRAKQMSGGGVDVCFGQNGFQESVCVVGNWYHGGLWSRKRKIMGCVGLSGCPEGV